jgi:thiol:disulfide interchange protein
MKLTKKLLRSTIAALTAFVFVSSAFAQDLPPDKVHQKIRTDQKDCEAYVIVDVTMEPGWHIYAANLPKGAFSIPTKIVLNKSKDFKVIGSVIEPKPHFEHNEEADEDLYTHEKKVTLKQKIQVLTDKPFKIDGVFSYQTCDASGCLPPWDVKFSVNMKGCTAGTSSVEEADSSSAVTAQANDDEPETTAAAANGNGEKKISMSAAVNSSIKDIDKMSLWTIFFLGCGSGFLALLTPCVFPMLPMTVSFFTKQSKTRSQGIRNAILYGVSIIVIYILLGTVVTAIFGAEALNNMATNPTFNIIFFVVLIVFAISFMGAFEIRMPSSWINKADSGADRGGLIGIFLMALVLALVSFSCTGAFVGGLISVSATVGGVAPIIGMFGFSFALALPFMLFAAFPGWMNSMPKSGGWLNTVKVTLGFVELALAFKFLSNADLSLQAHWLEREVFLAVWIAIFGALTLYLFGKMTLPHDDATPRISVGRAMIGVLSLTLVIYMIPGMWGAPLKWLSAFPPPLSYSESPDGFGARAMAAGPAEEHIPGTHRGPQKIMVFHDYDLAKAYADSVGKPLFVDFTGHNCVNCRKMEESVWGEPGIIETLRNDVVIASLHVDERIDLPKDEQVTVELRPGVTRKLQTTGDKWMFKQLKEYNITAQPYYVMIGPDGQLSNGSADYQNHGNPADFKKWLDQGMEEYRSLEK